MNFKYLDVEDIQPSKQAHFVDHDFEYKRQVNEDYRLRRIFGDGQNDEFEEKQIKLLENQLKMASVKVPIKWNKADILRFCYASDFQLSKAADKASGFADFAKKILEKGLSKEAISYIENDFIYCYGRDQKQRPILYIDFHKIDIQKADPEEVCNAVGYFMLAILEHSFVPGKVENIIFIVDAADRDLIDFPYHIFKTVIYIFDNFFPLTMEYMFVVNPSEQLLGSWKIISTFMEKSTEQKVFLLEPFEMDKMFDLISSKSVQNKYGGQMIDYERRDKNKFSKHSSLKQEQPQRKTMSVVNSKKSNDFFEEQAFQSQPLRQTMKHVNAKHEDIDSSDGDEPPISPMRQSKGIFQRIEPQAKVTEAEGSDKKISSTGKFINLNTRQSVRTSQRGSQHHQKVMGRYDEDVFGDGDVLDDEESPRKKVSTFAHTDEDHQKTNNFSGFDNDYDRSPYDNEEPKRSHHNQAGYDKPLNLASGSNQPSYKSSVHDSQQEYDPDHYDFDDKPKLLNLVYDESVSLAKESSKNKDNNTTIPREDSVRYKVQNRNQRDGPEKTKRDVEMYNSSGNPYASGRFTGGVAQHNRSKKDDSRASLQFSNNTFGRDKDGSRLPEWDGNKWDVPSSDEEYSDGDDENDGRGIFCGLCISRNNPRKKGSNKRKLIDNHDMRKKGYLQQD